MVVIQASDNTNAIKADLKRGQGGVPGALTPGVNNFAIDCSQTM